jgi:hypothetical protein
MDIRATYSRHRALLLAVSLLAVGVFSISVEARSLVVVASNDDSLKPGSVVDSNSVVTLPKSARVKFIGADGNSVVLHGPFAGKPEKTTNSSNDDAALITRLSRLFDPGNGDNSMPGGIRGAAAEGPLRAWAIDADKGGVFCMSAAADLKLWRKHSGIDGEAALQSEDGGKPAPVFWPAGSTEIAWPDTIPAQSDGKYLLRHRGEALPKVIILHQIPTGLRNDAERAAWMGEHGCASQARRLLQAGG